MTIQAQVQTQTQITRNSQCASLTAQQRSSLTLVQCSTTFSTSAHPASFFHPIGSGTESINTNQAQRPRTPCANSEASNNEANHRNSHSALKSIPQNHWNEPTLCARNSHGPPLHLHIEILCDDKNSKIPHQDSFPSLHHTPKPQLDNNGKLTSEEREHRIQRGFCLYYGDNEHIGLACPRFATATL